MPESTGAQAVLAEGKISTHFLILLILSKCNRLYFTLLHCIRTVKVCPEWFALLLAHFKIDWESNKQLFTFKQFHWLMIITITVNQDNQILCFGVRAVHHRSWEEVFPTSAALCGCIGALLAWSLCECRWQNIRLWKPKTSEWQIQCDWWEVPAKPSDLLPGSAVCRPGDQQAHNCQDRLDSTAKKQGTQKEWSISFLQTPDFNFSCCKQDPYWLILPQQI